MKCPKCQTQNPTGQQFCGACGYKLERACPQCGQTNPAEYKFCGQCGADLSGSGTITIVRSGLISRVSPRVLEMLGYAEEELHGKPFTLFVMRDDLVIFFTHWNELFSSAKVQSFDIALKHKAQKPIYVQLNCRFEPGRQPSADTIEIQLTEDTKNRLAAVQRQTQQDLLALIFSVVHNISTVSKHHLAYSIEDALKKICLFVQADVSFIYGINRNAKCLDLLYHWHQPTSTMSVDHLQAQSIAFSKVKNTILQLRKEKSLIAEDLSTLAQSQRDELLAWHNIREGALISYLFYSGKNPVGVIGVVHAAAREPWPSECKALVQFFGDFVAARLHTLTEQRQKMEKQQPPRASAIAQSQGVVVLDDQDATGPTARGKDHFASPQPDKSVSRRWPKILMDMSRPMRFTKNMGEEQLEQLKVFPRDDGLVLLTCPNCGLQESVPVGRFEKHGGSLRVDCPCHKVFAAVLEKRRVFRKSVRLDGYFSLSGDLGIDAGSGNIWGQMIVKDLSKAGLRFTSEKAHLIKPGDLLIVRFNLDNSNKALIQKPARVITVSDGSVGCRFEGDDSFDITLGFYFM